MRRIASPRILVVLACALALPLGVGAWWLGRRNDSSPPDGQSGAAPSAGTVSSAGHQSPVSALLPRSGREEAIGKPSRPGTALATDENRYAGSATCQRCHEDQFKLWHGSDHQRAMALATADTVRASFDGRDFTHFGATSKIFRRGDDFLVTTDNRQGKLETFRVKYTLGYRPLQQYMVEFPDGRIQCLPIAWDTEEKRFFHLYPNEPIPHTDVLHWTRPLQNWNYMCADCHTTNLQKNYHLAENRYDTTFTEMGVGCESCHGPGTRHNTLADSWKKLFKPSDYGLVRFKGADPQLEIDSCAPCHARRRIVAAGFRPGKRFLDHYMPELLDGDLYYADGQIRDEDFEYTSFIQSRMYHEKVRCTNCHDPHSLRVKFPDNRLCGQCHLATKYDTKAHHFHPDATKPGTRCVECHMPVTKYMVVDPRLDHSIRIPRPELTVNLGIPNACTGCHHDKAKGETPQWAVQQVEKWYGPRKGPQHFAYAIDAGRKGKPEGERLLSAVIKRRETRAVVRASAILLLSRYQSDEARSAALAGLTDADPLVRAASVRALEWLPADQVRLPLLPALRDPLRAVRVEAVRLLSRVPQQMFTDADRAAFEAALAEFIAAQEAVADQPAGHLNLGVVYANLGKPAQAKDAYLAALRIDPEFVPARINLAMLYDGLGQKEEAEKQFRRVIELEPKLAEAHYSLGLLVAENESRVAEAADLLGKAVQLAPDNARMRYNHALALQKVGRATEAEEAFRTANKLSPGNPDFLKALAILYLQQKRWNEAAATAQRLLQVAPSDPDARQLLKYAQQGGQ